MAGLPDKAPDNGLENRKPLRKGTDGGLDKRVASSSNDTLEALAGGGGGGSVLPESSATPSTPPSGWRKPPPTCGRVSNASGC